MRIEVTEMTIEDALGRARQRLGQADRQLSEALSVAGRGLPWIGLGLLAALAGSALLMGAFPLPGGMLRPSVIALLVLGGVFLGHGLPLWSRARREISARRCAWRHALDMVRLREQQAQADPGLTVEVLERVDGSSALPVAGWKGSIPVATRYVQ